MTYGADVAAAMAATELLEWACGVYVHACACGTPRVLDEPERRAVAEALATYGDPVRVPSVPLPKRQPARPLPGLRPRLRSAPASFFVLARFAGTFAALAACGPRRRASRPARSRRSAAGGGPPAPASRRRRGARVAAPADCAKRMRPRRSRTCSVTSEIFDRVKRIVVDRRDAQRARSAHVHPRRLADVALEAPARAAVAGPVRRHRPPRNPATNRW